MWATLCLLLGGACVSFSQNKPIVLKAARMFDGHRMLTPGIVVVSGTTIQGIGLDAAIPAGAQVMDFGDATLSPGFMDAHTHLSYPATNDYRQALLDGLQKEVPEKTLLAIENLRKTLMVGVTLPWKLSRSYATRSWALLDI